MGGCLSTHSRKQKRTISSSHAFFTENISKECQEVNDKASWVTKNGIGRYVQKEQATMFRSSQITDENCQKPKESSDRQSSFQASKEEVWFDSQLWLDSDSDEDFKSVYSDYLPATGNSLSYPGSAEGTPLRTFTSSREQMQRLETDVKWTPARESRLASPTERKTLGEFFLKIPLGEHFKSGNKEHQVATEKGDMAGDQQKESVQKSCLPRLLPSVSFNNKKFLTSPGAHKVKSTLQRFSFKRCSNDLRESPDPFPSKRIIERPIAGSQFPLCPADKPSERCWSVVSPSTFKLRSHRYMRDKEKTFASDHAIYEPFGVDLFWSPKKINHIAQYVQLPNGHGNGNLPSLLILNIQIPIYRAAIFLDKADGEGLNLVLYHKLSESYSTGVPSYVEEMFMKILNDEVERVRRFATDSVVPFRDRLKVLGRVVNPEELHLSGAGKRLVYYYNKKPVLSRPWHSFYKCENYLEVDLDVHRFSYIARKGVEAFRKRLESCILDIGLTIQGNKSDELPEQVLCCVRVNKVDFSTCKHLAMTLSSHTKSG